MVNPELEGDLQLGPYAVGRRNQHRIGKLRQIESKQASEAADLGEHLPVESLARQHLDALLAAVGRGDVHAGVSVADALSGGSRGRSSLRGLLQADGLLGRGPKRWIDR